MHFKREELEKFRSFKGPLIDVRSPNEYYKGHMPNSINIPLFNNEERSIIGIIYKKNGKEKAVKEKDAAFCSGGKISEGVFGSSGIGREYMSERETTQTAGRGSKEISPGLEVEFFRRYHDSDSTYGQVMNSSRFVMIRTVAVQAAKLGLSSPQRSRV